MPNLTSRTRELRRRMRTVGLGLLAVLIVAGASLAGFRAGWSAVKGQYRVDYSLLAAQIRNVDLIQQDLIRQTVTETNRLGATQKAIIRDMGHRLDLLEERPLPQLGSVPLANLMAYTSFQDVSHRSEVPCDVMHKPRTAILITAGQSNAANQGSGPHRTAGAEVVNYNFLNNRCYHAQDPLLGTTSDGSNFATILGDLLLERGAYDHVVIAPIAVPSSKIEQWVPGTMFHFRLLAMQFILPTHILWQQGEANEAQTPDEIATHRDRLVAIVRSLRDNTIQAPFHAALSTICSKGQVEGTRQAIRDAVSTAGLNMHMGPDTDAIGKEHRYDGCHFDATGLDLQAHMWADAITPTAISTAPH